MLNALYSIIIKPLILLFEVLFNIFYSFTHSYGIAIVLLSLCMNFLCLPLYKRADAIQDEENKIEKKLEKGVAHIKKTFKGDERYMMLQTYYRQNNYKPSYVLKGLLPLLLEIPFFMAAYNFLSNLSCLSGVSFGPISDLILPDKMILGINLLPILMTIVNIVSSTIYSKEAPLKSKIQLYLMATVFLVLLYNSPSGLVLYWTLNNVFSLVKNVVTSFKNKEKVINVGLVSIGIMLMIVSLLPIINLSIKRRILVFGVGLILIIITYTREHNIAIKNLEFKKSDDYIFFGSCAVLALFEGLYIPLTVIKSSPGEFVDYSSLVSPLIYVKSSLYLGIGTFVLWLGIYYLLSNRKIKKVFSICCLSLLIVSFINFMFFDKDFGIMSSLLIYDNSLVIPTFNKLLSLLIPCIVILLVYFFSKKLGGIIKVLLIVSSLSLIVICSLTAIKLKPQFDEIIENINHSKENGVGTAPLSSNGKNVVVIMLDRAISQYLPYIFTERPDFYEAFSGFTYYPNTIGYGASTNVSIPSMFGGYEYTPKEINKRSDESLVDKHNEALKVLPVLFGENDFDVTVCNPTYANYSYVPDLSIYDDYSYINAFNTNNGEFLYFDINKLSSLDRNLFCYSMFRTSPSVIKNFLYDNGNYRSMSSSSSNENLDENIIMELSEKYPEFINNYVALDKLEQITPVEDSEDNTYFSFINEMTHWATFMPNYEPELYIDDLEENIQPITKTSRDGNEIVLETKKQQIHYQTNMSALMLLSDWINYLKDSGVYDNTRIIIASDHGFDLDQFDLGLADSAKNEDVIKYNALLLVKDFDGDEFSVKNDFMTLADIPSILSKGLIENPTNPFTGKLLSANNKNEVQYVLHSDYRTDFNNGNEFLVDNWFTVHDNVFDINNWGTVE